MDNNMDSQVASSAANFFQKYKFKDDQQMQIRKRTRSILDGINRGDFTYDQVINGFNNTLGITNTNGFDDWGYAAAIVADAYKNKPEVQEQPKQDFSLANIGSEFTKSIFGTDNVNDYSYFQRNPTEQVSLFRRGLQNIYNNFDSIFSTYNIVNPEVYKSNIQEALNALKDDKITENDYLALSRATGITNFDKWFTPETTTGTQESSDPGSVVDRVTTPQQNSSDTQPETQQQQASYPSFENAPKRIISLKDNMNNDPNDVKGYAQILREIKDPKTLFLMLQQVPKGKDLNIYFKKYQGTRFKKILSQIAIIRGIITELNRRKLIKRRKL